MAKARRRRPPNRTKRRPPTREAAPRESGWAGAPTRTFVSPSRRARRAAMIRGGVAAGAALGLIIAVLVIAGGRSGSKDVKLAARPLTAKVLAPTVRSRTSSGTNPAEVGTGDNINEKAVIETDATGLGEFTYTD